MDLEVTPELKLEGIAREVIRYIQTARKDAGLNIDDRIELTLITQSDDIKQAIEKHETVITDETLAIKLSNCDEKTYSTNVKIDDQDLIISLQKA